MQAFNSTNDAISLIANVATKPVNQQKDSQAGGDDFLTMVLEAAAQKGDSLDEKDLKNIVNSVNLSAQKKALSEQKTIINANEILGEDEGAKLFENTTFMQLLQILEMLNGGEKISKFPNFTSPLAKALSNEANILELKGAKDIHELISVAKRLNLGLEKITITKEQVGVLNEKFPNLARGGFFKQILPTQIYNAELKAKVEEVIKLSKNSDEGVKLNQILQEISKEIKPGSNQNQPLNLEQKEQVRVQIPKQPENVSPQNLSQNLAKLPEEIAQISKQNLPQSSVNSQKEPLKNEILKPEEKSQAKINLQTLLFPEREQREFSSENEGFGAESELNSMVREIMQNARSQSKNLQLVRQTFDNFNTTLKEQVEAYKSPFMRFNITLNPLNLGEVEITMVNRGNNLHINFNSTTQTMNLFLQNQAEFKASLVNMGFTELEMNFSDQNGKKEQEQRAYKGSNSQDSELAEFSEQPLLEIVLPRYI